MTESAEFYGGPYDGRREVLPVGVSGPRPLRILDLPAQALSALGDTVLPAEQHMYVRDDTRNPAGRWVYRWSRKISDRHG